MPVAWQAHFEHLAVHGSTVYIRIAASVLALGGLLSLRGEELRATAAIETPAVAASFPPSVCYFRCLAAKGPSQTEMPPFVMALVPVGFLGNAASWISALRHLVEGCPFLLPDFVAKKNRAGRIGDAKAWKEPKSVLPAAHWSTVARDLLMLPPLGLSEEDIKASGFDVHAPHSLLACIARARLGDGFALVDSFELGRWRNSIVGDAPESAIADVRKAMPLRYSGGAAALGKEFHLRRKVCEVVSNFIGDRDWTAVLPFQKAQIPSYQFLRHGADVLEEVSDSESD